MTAVWRAWPVTIRVALATGAMMVLLGLIASQQVLSTLTTLQNDRLREVAQSHVDGLGVALSPFVLHRDVWEVYDALDRAQKANAGERILFKTVNSSYYRLGKFVEDFVHLRSEAANFLKEKRISVVGIDYLAVGSFKDRLELIKVHMILLSSGIWIIEALDLSNVTEGRYEIICLPVRIAQGDAGQARAIVRPI